MAEILIVEDHAPFREALADTLTDEGHAVRTAANGLQALEAFAEKRPDLVLLDVMMPGRDGYDVCAEMRAKDPLVPILMLTAKNAEKFAGQPFGAHIPAETRHGVHVAVKVAPGGGECTLYLIDARDESMRVVRRIGLPA